MEKTNNKSVKLITDRFKFYYLKNRPWLHVVCKLIYWDWFEDKMGEAVEC